MRRLGIPIGALAVLAFASAAVAQPGVPDFLADLNQAALGAYHEGRETDENFRAWSSRVGDAAIKSALADGVASLTRKFPVYR